MFTAKHFTIISSPAHQEQLNSKTGALAVEIQTL